MFKKGRMLIFLRFEFKLWRISLNVSLFTAEICYDEVI